MDLFLIPTDPAFPTDATPFIEDKERWTGEPFLSYGSRRNISDVTEARELEPSAAGAFLQTWFFFGLLSEVLCLNRNQRGIFLIDPEDAKRNIDALYQIFIFEVDGAKFIRAAQVMMLRPLVEQRMREVAPTTDLILERLKVLDECLEIAYKFIFDSVLQFNKLDYNVQYSLAALGELIKQSYEVSQQEQEFSYRFRHCRGLPWKLYALRKNTRLESQMLDHGWCPSEIEKFRTDGTSRYTIQFLSRLKKPTPWKNHAKCKQHSCAAFQIKMGVYQPQHTKANCRCNLVRVNLAEVMRILKDTQTYPVLTGNFIWNAASGEEQVEVEPYGQNLPYVAISHVWADGLGNPNDNCLPRCQIEHIASLVKELQILHESEHPNNGTKCSPPSRYRFWIDSLCCPVQWEGKKISLDRIADVYRCSTHTLVLDSSFTTVQQANVHPLELYGRIICCSAWMRRLWTLQEATLSQSLYFQFADRAIDIDWIDSVCQAILDSRLIKADVRCRIVADDLLQELDALKELHRRQSSPNTDSNHRHEVLVSLQRALNFRSVSVADDEPLCIATLLKLDPAELLQVVGRDAAQKRMAMLWKTLAKKMNGLPSSMIFYVERSLDIEGFRWAPRSLLASGLEIFSTDNIAVSGIEQHLPLELGYRLLKFHQRMPSLEAGEIVHNTDYRGLCVIFPGYRMLVQAHDISSNVGEKSSLYPWDAIPIGCESQIFLKLRHTEKWFRMYEHSPTAFSAEEADREKPLWTRETQRQLSKDATTGRCALIRDPAYLDRHSENLSLVEHCLLVLIDRQNNGQLIVRRQYNVLLVELSPAATLVANTAMELAARIAGSQVTADLIDQQHQNMLQHSATMEKIKDTMSAMSEMVAEAIETRPGLRDALKESFFEYGGVATGWELIAKYFSHHIELEEIPDTQVWIVD